MKKFSNLARKSLAGKALTRKEAYQVLSAKEKDLQSLLDASLQVRQQFFGRKVKICLLQNAQSGICPEDCHYCSQSAISKAPINKYRLLSIDQLRNGAQKAVTGGAKRYCMVMSARGPKKRDIEHMSKAVRQIKEQFPQLEICVSLGIMDENQARELKKAGVGWVNHNLNTSRRLYPKICTTHTYDDRIDTILNIKKAGLSSCCGGILGMGENDDDIVELAYAFRSLKIDSIPVNFLNPIPGTPLSGQSPIDPKLGLKALCLMRLLNPKSEIRMAAGREIYMKDQGARVFYPANSIFVEGYLTTPGQQANEARKLIRDSGFEVEEG
jgi:biotin synthase